MEKSLIAHASVAIDAPVEKVWKALIDPEEIKKYMFGAKVVSDWRVGGPIVWRGEWKGKPYEDKGTILQLESGRILQYSHFSPLSGMQDIPENYHTVTIEVSPAGSQTYVSLTQDHNASESSRAESEANWNSMLRSLKNILE